jgi:L-iditol 2-dehydrogenase
MATMRAAKLFGARDLRVVEMERPEAGPGEILLRIKAVAICPSDVRLWEDGHAGGTYPDHPFIQGHEFSAVVETLGEGVQGPAPGTPVAVTPLWSCGECELCREGQSNICSKIVFPSFPQADGAMAEFMVVPGWCVEPLPSSTSFAAGALIEPLQASVHAVSLAPIEPDWNVAIVGAGIIGLGVQQAVKARGPKGVYVADPLEPNRALAEKIGATKVVPFATDLMELLPDLSTQPRVVFECSGHPAALGQAMQLCRAGGLVVIVGVPHPDVVPFDTVPPRRKELHFVFSRRYARETFRDTVALLASGAVDLSHFPVQTYSLAHAPEAMQVAYEKPVGILRVVVTMD